MAYPRSSASGSPAATRKRGTSAAAKVSAKSVLAAKAKTGRVPAVKAVAAPAGKSKAAERPVAAHKRAVVALARDKAGALSCITVYRASPLERIDLIRRGIPASEAKRMFAELPIGQGAGFKALNLSTATVNKKARQGDMLSPEESERVVGFAKLVGQLEAMIQDSGDPTNFDAPAWMARWLTEPLPAFGGARPADLVDTMEGQGLVSAALAKIQSGAYA
jgi:putative toxin-antitoxin system antitoxin component (TIGR02293 family)